MRTADQATLSFLILCFALACSLCVTRTAHAHAVAQGALQIVIFPDRVTLSTTVSSDEVFVAATYGGRQNLSPLAMVRTHGDYLLAHFRMSADRRSLPGCVVQVPERATGRLSYEIEYRLTSGQPACIAVQQDALREFEFVPGNRWEATYVVRAGMSGGPAVEGLLLRSSEPLVLDIKRLTAMDGADGGVDTLRLGREYARHSILHILSGYDHLLFITVLVLAVVTLWDLVKVITAFTLAHSITLTLAVLNLVRLPEWIVEPMIATSIVFVALQNIIAPKRSSGAGRLCVAFFFGLFHGLGFAGGLLSAMQGMAGLAVGLVIATFSAGVEIGHQLIVIPVFCGLRVIRGAQDPSLAGTRHHVLRYGSAGIFLAGICYFVAALC